MAKKILFLGTHGQFNIGDELLLETFLHHLGQENEYFVNSYDPEFTTQQFNPPYNLTSFHTTNEKFKLLKLIHQADIVFFGGGSIIKELYKSIGRNPYSTLLMILAIVSYSKIFARKPIIMSNIGVGPLQTWPAFFLAKLILKQVNYISLRDQKSYQNCLKLLANKSNFHLIADAVFADSKDFFLSSNIQHKEKTSPIKLKVALNLNFNIENPEMWPLFLESLATGLKIVNQHKQIEIHGLPMQSRFNPKNDRLMLEAFEKQFENIPFKIHTPITPQEAAEIIASCDILVSERLHALIMASIIGVPILPLAYDVKVQELAEYLEVSDTTININETFTGQDFEKCFFTVLNQTENQRTAHDEIVQTLNAQLLAYFDQLRDFISKAA